MAFFTVPLGPTAEYGAIGEKADKHRDAAVPGNKVRHGLINT